MLRLMVMVDVYLADWFINFSWGFIFGSLVVFLVAKFKGVM